MVKYVCSFQNGRNVCTNFSVQVHRGLTENEMHILKRSNKHMQGGEVSVLLVINLSVNLSCICVTRTSVSGNDHSEAVNICVFTESFTADLFLCSNDQNAFLSPSPPGKQFQEIWSISCGQLVWSHQHCVSTSASYWFLDIQTILVWWRLCRPVVPHSRLTFFPQQLHGSLTSRHFSCHCLSQCANETTLYYLNNSHLTTFLAFPE